MKLCTTCNRSFGDERGFCHLDGTLLVDETELLRAALPGAFNPDAVQADDSYEIVDWVPVSQPRSAWVALPLGVLIGVAIAVGVYVIWMLPAQPAAKRSPEQPGSLERRPETNRASQIASFKPEPIASPVAQSSDAAEPEGSPVAPPEPAPPKPAPRLNDGPISTGSEQGAPEGRVLIKLKGAGSVEADAAWEDGQNLWYRRGSLVSSVKRDRVEAITEIAEPKPAPSEGAKP